MPGGVRWGKGAHLPLPRSDLSYITIKNKKRKSRKNAIKGSFFGLAFWEQDRLIYLLVDLEGSTY